MKKVRRNVALQSAIFASEQEQRTIAKRAKVAPEKLSHAIYGRRQLDDAEQQRIAAVLKRPVAELFAADEATS